MASANATDADRLCSHDSIAAEVEDTKGFGVPGGRAYRRSEPESPATTPITRRWIHRGLGLLQSAHDIGTGLTRACALHALK
jgi:hypothetical protein